VLSGGGAGLGGCGLGGSGLDGEGLGGNGLGGGGGGLTTSESSSPVFASTASIRAISELKPACSELNPPSTAANESVTLLIVAACAAACSAKCAGHVGIHDRLGGELG